MLYRAGVGGVGGAGGRGGGAGGRGVDCDFGFSAFGRATTCADESVGAGLRSGRTAGRGEGSVGRGGVTAIFCRTFCSEAREMKLVSCSWIPPICSAIFALSCVTCS